ncbi:putative esterase [Steroidobacter agaridevorans]|uniref:Putative esterase n=1 Tax=Steroidobacter agaridevorans TaxID=2695856 RepID=A0A829YHV3_9GAMM|nr:tannase/feruloyl esterase family alpha/beta hydrolase [Steroidobacter agaridevorans]GFE82411.1 putative esterase [Steroidobacter agaridevorans]
MNRILATALAVYATLSTGQSVSLAAQAAPISAPGVSASTGAEQCAALAGTRIGSATIEATEWVERGSSLLSLKHRILFSLALKRVSLGMDAPVDFCHVTAKLRPVPGSEITAGVWLPKPWNGKLLGIGGGGFSGGLTVGSLLLKDPLAQGFAGVATDAGHEDTASAKFAYDSAEKFKDYGYRANHVGAEFAKALIASYYSSPVKRSYFHGCSNGGRDALMLALRFPEDYDGIISGAPAAAFTEIMTSFIWNREAVAAAPKLKDKLQLVQDAVMAKCDALDGVKDQVLENPLQCSFDPVELQCKDGDGPNCLNAAEVGTLRKIYGGPRLSDGTQIFPGQPVGGEALPKNWEDWIIDDKPGQMGPEAYRWMVYRNPEWDSKSFDLSRDHRLAMQRMAPIVNSNDPDLSAFMKRGGKLMLYHGWNDAAIPAGATLDYHTALRKTLGPVADQQVRLFMVPGMMHCGGGSGATYFEKLEAMERWMESGTAPERIIATEYDPPASLIVLPDSKKVRTRPLCAWPKTAHYSGKGSSDDAANFSCQ